MHPIIINNTEIQEIEDDDDQIIWLKAPNTKLWSEESGLPISRRQAMKEKDERVRKNNQVRMDLTGIGQTNDGMPDEEQTKSAELLMYHTRMGHIGFGKLREMAKQGTIPSHLQHSPTPARPLATRGDISQDENGARTRSRVQVRSYPLTKWCLRPQD